MSEAERPEPFATVRELMGKYGWRAILSGLSSLADLDSKDEKLFKPRDRDLAKQLHLEIDLLLARMADYECIEQARHSTD